MPLRLHVLHRPDAAMSVILGTGTQKKKKVSVAFGWCWDTDEIELAQWMGGRIYPFECDLSDDGVWLYYNALNAKWDDPVTRGCFGALSRAPYFKAVTLWPVGNRWMSGRAIQRRAPDSLAESGHTELPADFSRTFVVTSSPRYVDRLRRDGWQDRGAVMVESGRVFDGKPSPYEVSTFSRPIRGRSRLERHHHIEPLGPRPFQYDDHTLVATDGSRHPKPDWQWADVDRPRNRLLWAENARLWAGHIGPSGLPENHTVLRDFNAERFKRVIAPY